MTTLRTQSLAKGVLLAVTALTPAVSLASPYDSSGIAPHLRCKHFFHGCLEGTPATI